MQNQTHGRCRAHRLRYLEQRSEYHLRELVHFGVRYNKKHQGRDKGVLCLEPEIQHSTVTRQNSDRALP